MLRQRLGQYAESFGEFAQFGPWPQAGQLEQVAGYRAADCVHAGFLWRDALGFLEGVQGLADLAAHGVRLGEVQPVTEPGWSNDTNHPH